MPTYEFACPTGHRFDRFFRKMSESVPTLPCPECGAEATRQLSGGAGLIFRGSGFYITDYGKDGKKSSTPLGKSEASEKGEKGDKAEKGEKGENTGKSEGAGAKSDGGGGGGDGTGGKPATPGGTKGSSSGGSSKE